MSISEQYEAKLAKENKVQKKKDGVYYTPEDTASLLADFFLPLKGENICDVGCGCGNLILAYLEKLSFDDAVDVIKNKLYLYEKDKTALEITVQEIKRKYKVAPKKAIHCDFLDPVVQLPPNAKVISNPPYGRIKKDNNWNLETDTNDLYGFFMEKILKQAVSFALLTPYSFLHTKKFYDIRKILSDNFGGMIFSFDNVPGSIFSGHKHGTFNSNKTNSTRAAISVGEKGKKGFLVSPLIRFKNKEKERLLSEEVLKNTLPDKQWTIDKDHKVYPKIHKNLLHLYKTVKEKQEGTLKDILSKTKTDYFLDFQTTGRYFTVCSFYGLNRSGKRRLYFENEKSRDYAYLFLNSSFAYWWFRVFDGGINITKTLLESMPLFLHLFNENDWTSLLKKLKRSEKENKVYKKNAGRVQESFKIEESLRNELNDLFLNKLQTKADFRCIHKNKFF